MEQERQKRESENPEFQSPDIPILCANNCGFFGSDATNNLCSKCYRDRFVAKSKASAEALLLPPSHDAKPANGEEPGGGDRVARHARLTGEGAGAASSEAPPLPAKKGPARCGSCNKKVGLMGFKCRCGELFCSVHRYSDKHDCAFDYRAAGQDAIAKANPVVKTDKLEKI